MKYAFLLVNGALFSLRYNWKTRKNAYKIFIIVHRNVLASIREYSSRTSLGIIFLYYPADCYNIIVMTPWYIAACYPLPILQCSGHQLDCFPRFGLRPPQLKQSALLTIPIQNFGKDNRRYGGNIVYSEFCRINGLHQCNIVQFLSVEAFDKKRQCCYNVRYEMKIL